MGRCADYALADRKDHMSIFITAPMDVRIKRIMEKYDLSESKARDMIVRQDKQRQNYYNYYATGKWGHCATYDLSVNSALVGIDKTVDHLAALIQNGD